VPVTIKAVGDFRQSIRDSRAISRTFTFVGPDGRSGTADNYAAKYDLRLKTNVKRPLGMGQYETASQFKLWQLYVDHPEWWQRNAVSELADLVANSRNIDETISSGYVRLDTSLFRNRLLLIGGVRFQRYNVRSESGLVDNLGRYLHDEEGELVLDPNTGRPIVLGGTALQVAENTNVERGILTQNSLNGYYPSINASIRLTENLQLRLSFAKSINYPNLNLVAGGTNISDVNVNQPRVTANSPLGPWAANNYDIDLSYFTETGGSFGVTAFRKDISNFVNTTIYPAGSPETRAVLDKYGYGQLADLGFEISEKQNEGSAQLDGWEFECRQTLDSYVPQWARGFTVFFNTSYRAAPKKTIGSALSLQSQRLANWGVVMKRGRFGANLRWNHRPEPKLVVPSITHTKSRTMLDIDLTYQLHRRVSIFANATNVLSDAGETFVYTANTPDYARRTFYGYYGVQCYVGVKGDF
jgi:TonB-dependent receptor